MEIFAHRGASGNAPENTLEAFSLAADMNADGVELDVQMSRDGELVVAHDEDIRRVSNGSGMICDLTLAELKRYTFNRTQPAYSYARMPTLKEVFELLKPRGLLINVELKNSVVAYPGLERKCIELAAAAGMDGRILYSSFNHGSLLQIKVIDRSLPCGLLYQRTPRVPWANAARMGMDAVHPQYKVLKRKGFCDAAHSAGIRVNPWTVNEEKDLLTVMAAGADIIITNYPDLALVLRAGFHTKNNIATAGPA